MLLVARVCITSMGETSVRIETNKVDKTNAKKIREENIKVEKKEEGLTLTSISV